MNSVEKVKAICKEMKIPISKLERDLGFSNGYIRGIKKGMLPADRMKKIADYLSVSEEYLINDDKSKDNKGHFAYYVDEETAKLAQEMFDDPDLRALHHMKKNMNPESFKAHVDMMKRMYRLEHPEDNDDVTGC